MTPENLVYWLQGYLEIAGPEATLSKDQVAIIKKHIDLVLTKVTPLKPENFTPFTTTPFGRTILTC